MDVHELQKLPLLRSVPHRHLKRALETALSPFAVGADELLLVEGERDDALLLIVEGEVEVLSGDPPVRVARMGPGQMLGDMTLFGKGSVRSASIRTLTPLRGLVLPGECLHDLRQANNEVVRVMERQALRELAKRLRAMDTQITQMSEGDTPEPARPEGFMARVRSWLAPVDPFPPEPAPHAVDVLRGSPAFEHLSADRLEALASELSPVAAEAGAVLIREGSQDGDAFVVASGRVDVFRTSRGLERAKVAELGPGELFGIVSLVHGAVRSATCCAAEPTWLLRVPKSLWESVDSADTTAARAMRLVLHEALSRHLRTANLHVAGLIGRRVS